MPSWQYIVLVDFFRLNSMLFNMRIHILCLLILCLPNSGITQQAASPSQIQEVDSLINLSKSLFRQGLRGEALEITSKAKTKALTEVGEHSQAYGDACYSEGWVLSNMGYYIKADQAYQRSKEIRLIALGNTHKDYIESLNSLVILRRISGHYQEAINCLLELKEIRESLYPGDHQRVTKTNYDLTDLYLEMGQYDQADSTYLNLKTVLDESDGPFPQWYAGLLGRMAEMYQEMGYFEKAEPTYLEALEQFNTATKRKSNNYIALLTKLASLYMEIGQINKAEPYFQKAKSQASTGWLFNKKLTYGPVLTGLANLYMRTADYEKAEDLYLSGIDEMESELQQDFPDYAKLIFELAIFYHETGNLEEAEYHYLEAITRWERLSGNRVPWYPKAIMSLGALYRQQGKYQQAEIRFIQAKKIWEETLGKEYPLYIINLIDLARLYWRSGDFEQADSLYYQAATIGRARLARAVYYMSERELNKYLLKFIDTQAEILSFSEVSPVKSQTEKACFDNALFYKGFLLNASIQIKNQARANPVTNSVFNQLNAYRRLIGKEYSKVKSERQNIAEYQLRADSLEKVLAGMSAGREDLLKQITWEEIRQSLDSNEVALEFIRYRKYDNGIKDEIKYAAILLEAEADHPIMVPLFKESELDFVLNPGMPLGPQYVQNIYAFNTRGLIQGEEPRPTLYDLIWNKIEALGLRPGQRIHLSAAGVLHRINLGAIPNSNDTLVSQIYTLVEHGSTRQIVGHDTGESGIVSDSAAIFGGVTFEPDTLLWSENQEQMVLKSDLTADSLVQALLSTRTLRGGGWAALDGTDEEAITLEEILEASHIPTTRYAGSQATEEAFKKIGQTGGSFSPRVLHVATHGFFFPDPEETSASHLLDDDPVFKSSDQPMIRSGLVLAGGNYIWRHGRTYRPDMEDGVLTAYEISQLDLSQTELVVLSACETGLGDIEGNEGVYGLQRAFKIAGVKYLIMSLWQVPDQQTKDFMVAFYQYWLEEDQPIPRAFQSAQNQIRQKGLDHWYWAGFVLVE